MRVIRIELDLDDLGANELGGAGASPWATPAAPSQDYVDTGTWDQGGAAPPAANQDYVDNGTWDQPTQSDSSWSDNSGGGWDSGGGSSDDTF